MNLVHDVPAKKELTENPVVMNNDNSWSNNVCLLSFALVYKKVTTDKTRNLCILDCIRYIV